MSEKHRLSLGQECVFTNRGTSGVISNDGQRCRITRLKPPNEWCRGEPEYVIDFLNKDHDFGCRECELEALPPGREEGD